MYLRPNNGYTVIWPFFMPSVRLWPAWLREKRKKAPTSRNDSLVLVVAGWHGQGRSRKAPTSCNDLLVLAWLRERPPTSLYDLLVLVVASVVKWKGRTM